jgi:hypothetical protein
MNLSALRTSGIVRSIGFPSVIAFAILLFIPPPAAGQEAIDAASAEAIQAKFEKVVELRLDGEYGRAIDMLKEIIAEYSNSEAVLRKAYNHLVYVYVKNEDSSGARDAARGALERFPNLTVDELELPGKVNDIYDELRKEMFGSFVIDEPKDCHVYLDSTHVGDTPLGMDLVRVGEYELTVTKSGYKDHISRIEIEPDVKHDLSGLSLDRERAWWYWPAWIGGAAVAVVAIAIGVKGDDPTDDPPDPPLPEPPPPPAD